MTDYDVAVVGGGIAGAATALGLARGGLSVCLLDAGPAPQFDVEAPVGLRVSTLTPASQRILSALGCWSQLPPERLSAFGQMSVWEQDPAQALRFSAEEMSWPALGFVVENELIRWALWNQLRATERLSLWPQTRLAQVQNGRRNPLLQLEDGRQITATLVVGADGAQSKVRELAAIEVRRWDYQQQGLVCAIKLEHPHQATAWQRFLDTGPLALLPLKDGHTCSIVWSLPKAQAEALASCEVDQFNRNLSQATQARFGAISCLGPRVTFPLQRLRAKRYCTDGVVLVGDAAHVVHPLAGQGANLGLLDAAALVELLAGATMTNLQAILRRYERWRMADNELVAQTMHGLRALYAQGWAPWPTLRRWGAFLVMGLRPVKTRLMMHASGFGGRVPQLAQNESHALPWFEQRCR